MKRITSISDDAIQKMTVILDDGSKVGITLEYIAANKGWYVSFDYGDVLTINKRRVVAGPNMLRAFRNTIPFGIACLTSDRLEPIYKNDFTTGRAAFYVLNPEDVQTVEDTIIPAYA